MPDRTASRSPGTMAKAFEPRRAAGCSGAAPPTAACAGRAAPRRRPCGDHLRHDLDGAGTGPDDRDPLAGQVDAVVPLRGMESGTAEFVHAFDVGHVRDVQRARARDQELSDVLVPCSVNTCQRYSLSSQCARLTFSPNRM